MSYLHELDKAWFHWCLSPMRMQNIRSDRVEIISMPTSKNRLPRGRVAKRLYQIELDSAKGWRALEEIVRISEEMGLYDE